MLSVLLALSGYRGFAPQPARAAGASDRTASRPYVLRGDSAITPTVAVTNESAMGASVLAASAPPTTSVTAPTNGATVTGTVTVSAAASDDVGVTLVEFYFDGI